MQWIAVANLAAGVLAMINGLAEPAVVLIAIGAVVWMAGVDA